MKNLLFQNKNHGLPQRMLCTLFIFLISITAAIAQNVTVKGKVVDTNGEALIGVNVSVKGTTIGTITDLDGNYTLQAPNAKSTLTFSFIGFQSTDVAVNNQSTINITLKEDSQNLDEVVVVGYGVQKKVTVTGSVASVSGEMLKASPTTNLTNGMLGRMPGVIGFSRADEPGGGGTTIRIRGTNTLGSKDPLIVIDGVPSRAGGLNRLNPSEIESMSVLKDATATAIYGARGANGVVLITTKKGKKGGEIILENKIGVNTSLLPRYDVIKNPEQYMGLAWQSMANFAKYGGAGAAGTSDPLTWASNNLFTPTGGQYGIDLRYNMWNVAGAQLIDPNTGKVRSGVGRKYTPENWEDYGFRNGTRSETNLSISGGADKTRFYSSFGYLKDEGYLLNSNFERYSTRLNVTHQEKKWLSGGVNLGYTFSKSKNNGQTSDSGSVFWFVDNIPSIFPLYMRDANGNTITDPHYGGNMYDYGDNYGRNFGNGTNAIADALYGKDFSRRHEVVGNANLKIDILPYLSFETKIGGNFSTRSRDAVDSKFYGPSASTNGSIAKYDYDTFNYTFLQMLKFDKRFGKHGISAFAAHESTNYEYNIMYAFKTNLVTDGGTELNNGSTVVSANSYTLDWGLESYFGNISYDYSGKYLLTANVRRDGSSRFKLDDKKWGTFGSVGLGWVVSREEFMKNNS